MCMAINHQLKYYNHDRLYHKPQKGPQMSVTDPTVHICPLFLLS